MPLSDLLAAWRADPEFLANVAAWRELPARPAQRAPLPDSLHPALAAALRTLGIDALYSHQAQAWRAVRRGEHPAVVTGTASGKTLCYNLPVLDRLLRHPHARALYLFPTKALAQDQLDALRQLLALAQPDPHSASAIPVATYDGDTPAAARPGVRRSTRIVLSNPDMLHAGVLPHHPQWIDLLQNLSFVVLDEMHVYRGVFGSHVANVLRRLKRLATFYGAQPRFILTSATIGNPAELAERLIEETVTLIDHDGSARGPRHFVLYNPPIVDQELGLRRSVLQESVRLARQMLDHDVQSILFGRTRRTVELALTYLHVPERPAAGAQAAIRGYRSGYLARQRREIERGLRAGRVRTIVATSALELGIDIGGLDAALLAGYPGTIASTWQQAGRAGRGLEPALSVLLVSADPLEQFLAHHPHYLFGRSPEHALIDADNPLVFLDHLRCAVYERPFGDTEALGNVQAEQVQEYLGVLEQAGELHRSGGRVFWLSDRYPAADVSLRSASPTRTLILEGSAQQQENGERPTLVGEVDQASVHWMVHPGAVYLHQGQAYLVDDLDLEQNLAWVHRAELDYYTQARSETTVEWVELWEQAEERGASKHCGEILVTSQVTGYRKLRWFTQEPVGEGEVDLPPTQLLTAGYWLVLNEATVDALRRQGLWGSDPNRYGPTWPRQRDRARARDGYRCQVCGVPETGPSGRSGAHHVHHKIPFRRFASSAQANRLDNLITLCPRCHQRVEQAVRVRSGLSGLAYLLRRLAPLYLMCDRGDIGVQSDPRSPLAGKQPAIVFYERVPGGLGFSRRLYDLHQPLIERAQEWVAACPCSDGCPSCVGPPGEDGVGGKQETISMLGLLSPPQVQGMRPEAD